MDDKFNIEDYIKSEDFYNFIHYDCFNEVLKTKRIDIPTSNEEIYRYIVNFFFKYNLAHITLGHIILEDDITIDDIEDAYQTEVLNLKENQSEYIYQQWLEKLQAIEAKKEEKQIKKEIFEEKGVKKTRIKKNSC